MNLRKLSNYSMRLIWDTQLRIAILHTSTYVQKKKIIAKHRSLKPCSKRKSMDA